MLRALPTDAGDVMMMSERLDHLMDGREVVAPLALAGHYPRASDDASPVVAEVLLGDEEAPRHPYSGGGQVLARFENDQLVIVATDRLAHAEPCSTCAPTWERLRAAFDGLPDDASITAAIEVETSEGTAGLLVDVFDLPDDYFDDEEGTD